MKKTFKALMAATALAGMLPLSASAQDTGIKKIGLAVPNLQADFFNQIKLGVENYGVALGIEVITVDAKGVIPLHRLAKFKIF